MSYYFPPKDKPRIWGNFADRQYAIRENLEKIYKIDPDNDVLRIPLFWGLPILDYSNYANHGTNHGATYKNGSFVFNGSDTYINVLNNDSLKIASNEIVLSACYYHEHNQEGGALIGKTQNVLVEKIDESGFANGYGEYYVPIKFKAINKTKHNDFAKVEIIEIEEGEDPNLIGTLSE